MNNQEFRKKTAEVLGVIEHYTSYKGKSIAECIKNGFVVIHKDDMTPVNIDSETFDILKPDRDIFSHTLFGNFEIPANMSDEEYYTHQILHYFSTYGLEFFGLKAQPYIPAKEIWKDSKAAQVLGDVKDLSIKVYFQLEPEEYKATIEDYILNLRNPKNTLIDYYRYALEDVLDIDNYWEDDFRSYEIKTLYFDISGQLPENPIDALRYIIYIITGNTLIIKNRSMRKSIQAVMSKRYGDEEKFNKVKEVLLKYDWTKFAQIFLRFKPIFLAMKCNDEEINHAINKIRKLAIKYHKPLDGLCVQNVIEMYLGEFYSAEEIARYLKKVDTRDIFKLMNSILNANNEYKIFGIRNGRTFVKEGNNHKDGYELDILYSCCIDILRDRYPDMKNKVFYIPEYMDYGLPISEKDMVNAYPNGTAIKVCPDNMDAISVGVAWKNKEKGDEDRARVDIDLHLISATAHFGWNSSRKNETDTVIYSGDITDGGKEGASEAFYMSKLKNKTYIIDTRLFTHNGPVEMKLFANRRPVKYTINRGWNRDVDKSKQYIYNPNENVIPEIPLTITNDGLNIGLLHNGILYLYNKSVSSGIVPGEHYENFINGLTEKFENSLLLGDVIKQLGGEIITNIDECDEDTIMLNPEVINETTLFKIFEEDND